MGLRIAVNLRKFEPGEIGGIENYVRHVVGGIARDRQHGPHELTIFAQDIAADAIRSFAPAATLRLVPHHACGLSIEPELDDRLFDVLLCPQMGLDPLTSALPSVAMIADHLTQRMIETLDASTKVIYEELVPATAANADVILTASNYTRDSLLSSYGLDPERVIVVYPGVDSRFRGEQPAPFANSVDPELAEAFVYFPANFWLHKNHCNLLAAFALVLPRHPELRLLLTGAPATGAERVQRRIDELALDTRVKILGHVPTALVAALMRRAQALVFPTLYEGFGIPPLEAFNVGTPVISSGAGGNREVVGDAALLVDPLDPQSIAAGIDGLLTDPPLRNELIARGRERAALFSWPAAVETVLHVLYQVTSSAQPGARVVREPTRMSLVTAVVDSPQFLNETIDSVLAQEYPYVDYLVLSSDALPESFEILSAYRGRLRWCSLALADEPSAINEGFKRTQGDLFAFLAAGDRYGPDTLWRAVAHYDAQPTVAVVFGDVETHADEIDPPHRSHVIDEEGLVRTIHASAAFLTRTAFGRAGALDPQSPITCVEQLWQQVAIDGGTFRYTRRNFARTRAHRHSRARAAMV